MLFGACAADAPASQQADTSVLEFDDLVDRVEQENVEIDRLVSQCMAAQGFTYIPADRTAVVQPVPLPTSATDRDHAQQWGYGILTGLEAEQIWLNVLKVEDVQRQLDGLQEQADGERQTYNLALYGSAPLSGRDVADPGSAGCLAEAVAITTQSPDSLAARNDRFDAASIRVAADARITALDATWARCMNGSGYDFSRPDDITDMLMEIAEGFYQRLPSVSGTVVDRGDGPVEVAPDAEAVAAFTSDLASEADRERELALADIDCFVPIADDYSEIEQEYFGDLGD